jgi:hypothetical protein
MGPYSFSFTFGGVIESPPAVKMIWRRHSRVLDKNFSASFGEVLKSVAEGFEPQNARLPCEVPWSATVTVTFLGMADLSQICLRA